MACYRTATRTDSHALKSGSGAGGAGAAGGRVVSGAAAEVRSTAGSQQVRDVELEARFQELHATE